MIEMLDVPELNVMPYPSNLIPCRVGGQVVMMELSRHVFNQSTAARHTVLAGATGKMICVLWCKLIAAAAVTVTLESATTAIDGPCALGANGGYIIETTKLIKLITASGAAFNVSLGGAVQVGGAFLLGTVDAF